MKTQMKALEALKSKTQGFFAIEVTKGLYHELLQLDRKWLVRKEDDELFYKIQLEDRRKLLMPITIGPEYKLITSIGGPRTSYNGL